jgi:hypothetical protein
VRIRRCARAQAQAVELVSDGPLTSLMEA